MQVIDPKVEKPARDMLGHAIRGELQDLAVLIQAVGGETYRHVLALCLTAAAYIATDVSGRWPTDADVREIARRVASKETAFELNEEDVYAYVSRAALGFGPLGEAFGNVEKAAALPVLITGSMLFRFRPRGQDQWDYLDQIWNATLAAENLDGSVLPAVQIRIHRTQLLKDSDTAS
jgi:hypothetical protein